MPSAPLPALEAQRLAALYGYGVLDTPPEPAFDELVKLAARICDTPISLVSLVDQDRQWFKARHGIEFTETSREVSFCSHTFDRPAELLIVPDATLDPRFSDNPLVLGAPNLRFYAGVPLCTPEGFVVGTLCVAGDQPRSLSAEQQDALRVLGRQVMAQLELRRVLHDSVLNHTRLENSQRIASLGDWEHDLTNQRLIWSDGVYRILGLARSDSPPNSEIFYRHVHPDDLAFVHREKKAAADGLRRAEFEHRIVRPNGEIRYLHQIAELVRDAQGRVLRESGTIQDITERKISEGDLRRSEARFRALSESAPLGIFECNAAGRVIYYNPALALLSGRPADESLGQGWADSIHPDDRVAMSAGWQKAVAGGTTWDQMQRILRPDGSIRWVHTLAAASKDGRGIITGYVGTVEDITEQRAAEVGLRESEERFKLVARAVSDVVWDWNLVTNAVWWNDGFLTTFGFVVGEIEPSVAAWVSLIHPEESERVVTSIRRAIDQGAASWSGEYRFERKDHSYVLVQDRGYIIRNADGLAVRMVGGMRDLTEQKTREAQFVRAQRMESIGTLAGGIAHDLNNVLSPIMMSIELLQCDSTADPKRHNILDTIQTCCHRGADLVRQVLSFARGVNGERGPVNFRHLISELESIFTQTFPRNIQVWKDVSSEIWPVMGDSSQLHQVLLNLGVNARDAMPQGGTLALTAVNLMLSGEFTEASGEKRTVAPGPYVRLQVSDTGLGIPAAIRERMFEPFFTTKEVGKGTGLGLATVQIVVKGHGGFITVDSEIGKGSTFTIYLPAEPDHAMAIPSNQFGANLPRGQDELVLVVDDEFSIRHITQQTLEAFGYRVITASNGAEAVSVYAQQSPRIALVLTDMMMPVMDGASTIQALRRINPFVRIIAASGLEAEENGPQFPALRGYDSLPKPYTAQTLLTLIREVLDRRPPLE
jgi:two-component system cell cycle sensor histidine kinase/response regulator CckA